MCKCLSTQVACCCCSCALNILISVLFVVLIVLAIVAVAVYFGFYKVEDDSQLDKLFNNLDKAKNKVTDQLQG